MGMAEAPLLPPIEVRRYGSGSPVAVLHGGPGAPGSVAQLANALGGDFTALEPLLRRSGEVPLTVAQHVEDLAGVITEAMPIVGWSWGAMLGLSFAAAHPELVSALVLVGCGTYDSASRAMYERLMRERLGDVGQKEKAKPTASLALAVPDERDRILGQLGDLAATAQAYDAVRRDVNELSVDAVGHEETWRDVLRLQESGVEPSRFGPVHVPVLMVHGSADPHPGPPIRDSLRAVMPQVEYVEIPRCGHTPCIERAGLDPLLATISPWIRRNP
jgi:pimeloyl-ACP methyl ester carboxylesterase